MSPTATPTLSDLRSAFFGGGSAAEYAALNNYKAAGIVSSDVLAAAQAVKTGAFAAGRGFASGRFFLPQSVGTQGEGTDPDGKNQVALHPFPVGKPTTFDRIGTYVATGQPNTNVRVGLYDDVAGVPTNLLVDSGPLDSTVGTTLALATIALTLQPGMYWLAVVWQGSGGTMPSITRINPPDYRSFVGLSAANIGGGGSLERYYAIAGAAAGALPNPAGAIAVGNSSPIRAGWMRAA